MKELVSLTRYQIQFKKAYEWLISNLQDMFIPDQLVLSALGARICYSDVHPLDLLLKDERIADPEKRLEFLNRLYKAGHFSVFAHSPAMFDEDVSRDSALTEEVNRLYKLWFYSDGGRNYYCANVRHLTEALRAQGRDFQNVFRDRVRAEGWRSLFSKILYFTDLETCFELTDNPQHINLTPEEKESGVLCFFIDRSPWQWFGFVVHGYSRIFSHQFVRHTWINFSQRSHRYTKVDAVVVPKSVKQVEPAMALYHQGVQISLERYLGLIKRYGIPKEDARFITPAGATTTIMASGPRFIWEDFVLKRNHPKAQWEIRRFSEIVDRVLEITLVPRDAGS